MNRNELIELMARAAIRERYGEDAILDHEQVLSADLRQMSAALSVIDQAGMVIVPREPTEEMKQSAAKVHSYWSGRETVGARMALHNVPKVYAAMLEASPLQGQVS